jgi:CO dehydrogenase/acetyl-CoA synthase beta subunit
VWKRFSEWKIFMGTDRPHGSCGKKALNHQIFIIGYLQFVERKHLHAAPCSTGYGASAMAGNCTGSCPYT